MKKLLLLLAVMIGSLFAHAEKYIYLTFETTDGAKISVAASSLNITITGTTLKAGGQSFTLSNLSKMYFSTSDLTTAINTITDKELDKVTEIFDLNGRKVTKDQMRSGVYIVKSKSGTFKIVKK